MKKLLLICSAFLLSISFATAQTYVSGGIFSNTTWTTAGSPYIITDTVVVFPGVTLTIQPGVTVEFDNNMQLEIRQAQLIASGTAANAINFISSATSPSIGIYQGILLNGGSMSSQFEYCNFSYANIAINASSTGTLTLQNCTFDNNNTGANSTKGSALVSSCSFTDNTNIGLYLNFLTSSTISGCSFTGNGTGLSSSYYHGTTTNCTFTNNQTGLSTEYQILSHCTILHNQTGISSNSENVYRNLVVDSNTVTGISANGDSVNNCRIEYNGVGIQAAVSVIMNDTVEHNSTSNISDNGGWGGSVILGNVIEYSPVGIDNIHETYRITMNTVENNTIGLKLNNSTSTVSCNSLCNNTTYSIQYGSSGNVNVSNNYWCLPDSASISATIYDGYENTSLGLLIITPFDTAPCTSSNPSSSCTLYASASATSTSVCKGDSTILMASVSDSNSYTVTWQPGGYTGMNYIVHPSSDITYTMTVVDSKGCRDSSTIRIDTINCSSSSCTLTVNTSASNTNITHCGSAILYANTSDSTATVTSITWSPGGYSGTPVTVAPSVTTTYTVTVTDSKSCTASSSITIFVDSGSTASASICYVTSDTASNHNIIVWSKAGLDTNAVDSIVVYRQGTTSLYLPIGSASIHGYTEYTDATSNPESESYFYEIALKDTCGNSSLSAPNETVLLQSFLGLGNVVDLSWNFYQGATVNDYRILRDDSGLGNWHIIDSVPGTVNAYTDRTPPTSPNLRYMLNFGWSLSCTPYLPIIEKKGDGGSNLNNHRFIFNKNEAYSNITNIAVTGIAPVLSSADFDVYPNPASTGINITLHQSIDGTVTLTNVLGQDVYSTRLSGNNGSIQKIDISNLTQGVYFLKIESNGQILTKKVLKI